MADVNITTSSAANKAAHRRVILGDNTITVGAGGDYATIDLALAYLETVTGMVQVAGSTGTVTATQDSDRVAGAGTNFRDIVRAGDLIKMSGDGVSPYIFLKADIYFPVYGDIATDTGLVIATGFVGVSGAGKTYEIWRPNKYVLLLLPGIHAITSSHTLPEGINLTITGTSKSASILEGANSAAVPVLLPRCGIIDVNTLTLSRSIDAAKSIFDVQSALDAGYINFSMSNIALADFSAGAGNLIVIRACNAHLKNIVGTVYSGLGNFGCDELIVSNLSFRAYNGGADVCVFTDTAAQVPGATHSSTKEKYIDSCFIMREEAYTAGAGGLFEIQDLQDNRVVNASNLVILDKDQGGNANPNCLVFGGGGTGVLNLRNSLIQPSNNAAGEGGITSGTAGDQIYLYGVYGDAGAAVITDGAATFTTVY